MNAESTSLFGLLMLRPKVVPDERGFFAETLRLNVLEEAVHKPLRFVQANHARSSKGVLRGLHAEQWDKLIYCPRGTIFSAIVDLRPCSPTFGQHQTFELSEHNRVLLYIPKGFANGYCVLSEEADYTYLVTDYYTGQDRRAVAYDDPDLAVQWPVANPLVSARDRTNPSFRTVAAELTAAEPKV
jgi:dTDP-4-dehydrorhamnose 3,5-epimerase